MFHDSREYIAPGDTYTIGTPTNSDSDASSVTDKRRRKKLGRPEKYGVILNQNDVCLRFPMMIGKVSNLCNYVWPEQGLQMNASKYFLILCLVSAVPFLGNLPMAAAQVQPDTPRDQKQDKDKGNKDDGKHPPPKPSQPPAPKAHNPNALSGPDDKGSGNEHPPSLGHPQHPTTPAPGDPPKPSPN